VPVIVDRLVAELRAQKREEKLIAGVALQLIDLGYKAAAIKAHPDRGGSDEAMIRLNRARDLLKATCRELTTPFRAYRPRVRSRA
jgi:hypothetical protein